MNNNLAEESQFTSRAINSNNLRERSNINSSYGTNDFDSWVDSIVGRIDFSTVLDICCGTGNQLMKYAKKTNVDHIIGVDVSSESLNTADQRLQSLGVLHYKLLPVSMEEMFSSAEINTAVFDLISCFYGLYYSKDVSRTLHQMVGHLSGNGAILIVGPYGRNNAVLFNILQKYFALPELVLRSSTTFIENEVIPVLCQQLTVQVETFVNNVRFPDVKAVMDYWKASTFYSQPHEAAVMRDVESHFQEHGAFAMEKHVMACIARKA
ncbi:MAG: methyltransferase domain-containing protein [Deltaproteobacteria bacterium]|nr:methyltransferase domain-containing protein [Deltaproteobacteria bacterium]